MLAVNIKISDLMRTPFVSEGRDFKVGLDCWGLVMEVSKRAGIELPDFIVKASDECGIENKFACEISSGKWRKLDKAEVGSIVVIRNSCGPFHNHFGVYLGYGKFIHALKRMKGIVVDRISNPIWKTKIDGFYVLKK